MAGLSPYYGMASVFWVGTLTGLFGGRCVRVYVCLPASIHLTKHAPTPHTPKLLKKKKTTSQHKKNSLYTTHIHTLNHTTTQHPNTPPPTHTPKKIAPP